MLLKSQFVLAPDCSPYLSTSPDLDGIKAISLLLVQPYRIEQGEQEFILGWVKQGNDLLLFDENPEETIYSKRWLQGGPEKLRNIFRGVITDPQPFLLGFMEVKPF